jgi:hypothetical protein
MRNFNASIENKISLLRERRFYARLKKANITLATYSNVNLREAMLLFFFNQAAGELHCKNNLGLSCQTRRVFIRYRQ